MLEPSFAVRGGRVRSERIGARVRKFDLGDSRTRLAISVGGSEHLALPPLHPRLQEVDVLLGRPGAYGPVVAFGLNELEAGVRAAGIARVQ